MNVIIDCPHCGRPVIDGSLFCLDCGAEIIKDAQEVISGGSARPAVKALAGIDLTKLTPGAYVIVTEGIDRGLRVALAGDGPLVIGRYEAEIALKDPYISRRHAQLELRDRGWLIRDLASANCTFVNSRPIEEHALVTGDIIEAGYSTIVFYIRE